LFKGFHVHEVVAAGVGVEVLHFVGVQVGLFHPIFGPEAVFQLVSRLEVAQLALDHTPPVAGGDMHHAQHPVQLPVVDDDKTGPEFRCYQLHENPPSGRPKGRAGILPKALNSLALAASELLR
jgi:hypothetical protein